MNVEDTFLSVKGYDNFYKSSTIGSSRDVVVLFCLNVLSVPGNDLMVHYTGNN